ncbi:hypothetical protein ES705_40720 [subsurface metagenome]
MISTVAIMLISLLVISAEPVISTAETVILKVVISTSKSVPSNVSDRVAVVELLYVTELTVTPAGALFNVKLVEIREPSVKVSSYNVRSITAPSRFSSVRPR